MELTQRKKDVVAFTLLKILLTIGKNQLEIVT